MITITYHGKTYQVGYTRQAAQNAESAGFVASEVSGKPALMVPILVYYGFQAHNSGIKRKLVEEIYDQLKNKDAFVTALIDMYADTVNTLMDDSSEGEAEWTMD